LFETLISQAAQGDQRALMSAIEIRKNPQKMSEILDKFYTAEGDEPSPEELALLGQQQQQQGLGLGASPVGIEQVLGALGQQPAPQPEGV
jgi:hypothetical protein